jgi:hypothetical protein
LMRAMIRITISVEAFEGDAGDNVIPLRGA